MYSRDIADWRSCQPPLDRKEEMECIISASHRNICEKLEGLKELQMQGEGEESRDGQRELFWNPS